MYSGITSGRVLDRELLYTKILEVNLFAFAYRLFHEDFSSIDGTLYSKYVAVTCFYHEHNETFSKSPHPVSGFMVNVSSCKECSHHENESLTLARTKALSLTHTYPHNPLRKIKVTILQSPG